MGLLNAIGSWFEKISDGWIFGSQLHKLIFRKNAEIIGTDDMLYEYQFQPKTGTVAHLDDIYPPVEKRYASQALMISDQSTQKNQYIYFDGTSYWEYLGTTNGNISDYRSLGTSESFVPYLGAVDDVDLGEFGLKAGNFKYDTTPTNIPTDQGTTYWDDAKQTIALIMNGTTQHIGHDVYFHVKNSSGATIPKGRNVRFAGTDGASGHLLIEEFLANGTVGSDYYMGVTSESIPNGGFGKVVFFGELEGVDTSAYPSGTLLYASTTVAGGFQTTIPSAPNNIILIAATINSKSNGDIFIRPTLGSNINKDEGVKIVNPIGRQGLIYNENNGLWENQPIPQMLENGLISGGVVQWSRTGYTFNVGSAIYRIAGSLYNSPSDVITLSPSDPINDRIDVFAVDLNGDVIVIAGTPAALPVKPQINPLTQIELTSIIVSAASTGPTLIDDAIYLENVEWVGSFSGSGTANFASTNNPDQGTLSTETTGIQNGSAIVWTRASDLVISDYQTLGLRLRLKASMGGAQNIRVEFLDNSNAPVSTALNLPIDKVLVGSYQFVGVVLSAFTFTSTTVRKIRFTFLRGTGTVFFDGFNMDNVKLEGGINPPASLDTFLGLLDTPSSYLGQKKKNVTVKENESGLEFTDAPSPVSGSYASSAAMFADQINQSQGYIYFDGAIYYEYLGTTNGDITDYRELGGGNPEFYESITFAQLQTLIGANELIPGKTYMVNDFQTIHRIIGSSDINTGPIEPLISVAVDTNRLSSSAVSSTYPRDIITVDWTNILCEDGVTPRKGWIIDRFDPILNIHIEGYDWRHVKFRRWRIVRKRKDEITAVGANSLDLFVSTGGSLGSSVGATFLLNAYTASGLIHSAGSINITIRNGSFSYTKPLIKFDNNTVFTANELANRSGQITYCPNRDAFVFMYMSNNGFGENIVGFTLAPTSAAIWSPGNGISYDIDNTIFADFTTLGSLQTSYSVRIGMSPNASVSNMSNNVFYFGAIDLTMGTNCYGNTSIYGIQSMTTGNQFYNNYMIPGMAWCQFNEEVFNCYFNNSSGSFTGGIQDVTFTNTVYNCSFYLGTYYSIELTAGVYCQFYLEGNHYNFSDGLYENSRIYLAGNSGGEGRTHFICRMPFINSTIGYFYAANFTINQRLSGVYYYQRPLANNIFDSIALRNIPAGTPISSIGVDAQGNVVLADGVTLDAIANNGNTSPVVLKHPDGVAPEDSATVGQLENLENALEATLNLRTFGITIDGAGNPITTGLKGYTIIPYNCEVLAWYIIADTTGSIEIDVWKAVSIPNGANSICGADRPKLVSAQENQNETLTAWSIGVTSGDVVAFNVVSASTVTKVNLVIKTKVII